MPRIARGLGGGGVAHVLNRGNARATVFRTSSEYSDFVELLGDAQKRCSVDVLAFCIMPNHFHMVVHVAEVNDLSRLMQWWLTSHVRRHHRRLKSSGHVWQGRFKSFPVQEDAHLLTVLRYVLLNPCKARLVEHPREWSWSSLRYGSMLAPWPVSPPVALDEWLKRPMSADESDEVQRSIQRGNPLGDSQWVTEAARNWGLESTLRPRGRPCEPGATLK